MEILENDKGRGLFATQNYQPWDLIHVDKALCSVSTIYNKDYIEIAKKTKDSHVKGSFINLMMNFIGSCPEGKIKSADPALKIPLIYLLNGGTANKMSHLAKAPKLSVNNSLINKTAKQFNVSKDDLKLVTQIFQANSFSIPGLFFTDIGTALFDYGSMLNHSCDPNAFVYITYDKMMIYARKPIKINEEITISYKPLCVPNITTLLEFKCQCGSCTSTESDKELVEIYCKFIEPQSAQDRIDYMIKQCNSGKRSEYMQLLIESYYDIWTKNGTYREKDMYNLLKAFKCDVPSMTWIDSQLLRLVLAQRMNCFDEVPAIVEGFKMFLTNKDIMENIVVITTLIPTAYHTNLISILTCLGYAP